MTPSKLKLSLALVAGLFLTLPTAHAAATSEMIDFCSNGDSGPTPYPCNNRSTLVSQSLRVSIAAEPQDMGFPSAMYLGLRTDGQVRGVFTETGWKPYEGGLFPTLVSFQSLPGQTQSFNVFAGGLVCTALGPGNHDLWAGYGILDADGQRLVNAYKNRVSKGITEAQLIQTGIQSEMARSKRVWQVRELYCPVNDSNSMN